MYSAAKPMMDRVTSLAGHELTRLLAEKTRDTSNDDSLEYSVWLAVTKALEQWCLEWEQAPIET